MANEVINSTWVTNGGRISAVVASALHQQLFDPTDLRQFITFYPPEFMLAATMDIVKDAVPGAAAAASSETSGGFSNSAYTTGRAQLTVARYGKQYQAGDLFQLTGEGGANIDNVIAKLTECLGLTMTDLITALFPSLANSVGATTVDLSVTNMYSAMFQLILSNVPISDVDPAICVLHPQQIVDFMTSLRGETGAMQWSQATQDQLKIRGPGIKGLWNNVLIVQSDSVGTANVGADRAGAMFGRGCFGYTLAGVQGLTSSMMINPSDVPIVTDVMFVERDRSAGNALSAFIANFYPAVVEVEDLRGVQIVTDA